MKATYVALLRGVNVGGNNSLPMKDLKEMFVSAECTDVLTFIQSGNVIFRSNPDLAAAIPSRIADEIGSRFGHRPLIHVRTKEQLEHVLRNNPFLEEHADEGALHVMFLGEPADVTRLSSVDSELYAPEAFAVRGSEIYVHLPRGAGRSKLLGKYFDANLRSIGTMRNWRTVTRLLALMSA